MAKLSEPKYSAKMRWSTERFISTHTVEQVRAFFKQIGVIEEDADEFAMFIPKHEHEFVKGKTYDLINIAYKGDEFIITEDGRVFYSASLRENIEVID